MRPFTHDDVGVEPDRWHQQTWWHGAPVLTLPPRDTHIVVLAAHPDDETLGVGGLLHAAAAAGHRVSVVVASDGEASHPASPTHRPADLIARRRVELAAAVARLAPAAAVTRLARPDGHLVDHVAAITAAVDTVLGADTDAWLLTTWVGDGHPDHEACAQAGRRVVAGRTRTRLLAYPIWLWHAGDPEATSAHLARVARRFPLRTADRAARAVALAAYPSQIAELSPAPGDEAVLSPAMLAHFDRDQEILLDVAPRAAAQPSYFDALYAGDGDPWDFAGSWYERRKREILLASLPRATFRRAFEPGSARGDLSLALADRVDELWTAEWSAGPLAVARARLAGHPHVRTEQLRIPADWPPGEFDLVVLSEIGYYVDDLAALAARVSASLTDDGVLVLLHWRRAAPDHPHTAETVHGTLREATGLHRLVQHQEDDFLLDVLARDPASVAGREGLLPP